MSRLGDAPERAGAPAGSSTTRELAQQTLAAARGRETRDDPLLATTGGPAGNARLTAWTGLSLLPLIAVELVTLLALGSLISWHIVVGVLLVPVALLKTGTVGWRIARYYLHAAPYEQAGPPPLPLRILGPLVILSTLAVLGTGLSLIALGQDDARRSLLTVAGQRLDALTLHQASFIAWAVLTGLHLLGRIVPAFGLVARRQRDGVGERVPGGALRLLALGLALAIGALVAVPVLHAASDWT